MSVGVRTPAFSYLTLNPFNPDLKRMSWRYVVINVTLPVMVTQSVAHGHNWNLGREEELLLQRSDRTTTRRADVHDDVHERGWWAKRSRSSSEKWEQRLLSYWTRAR